MKLIPVLVGSLLAITPVAQASPAQEVDIAVTPDGSPGDGSTTVGGHGIEGMRARAEKLGGTLTAGRVEGGFEVRCVLILKETA